MKYFYSHLIEVQSLVIELDKMDLSPREKSHLAALIDSTLHHSILDTILEQLSPGDKEMFLRHLTENNHDRIWKFLNEKVEKIEDKVKITSEQLKEKLHQDLKEARKIK